MEKIKQYIKRNKFHLFFWFFPLLLLFIYTYLADFSKGKVYIVNQTGGDITINDFRVSYTNDYIFFKRDFGFLKQINMSLKTGDIVATPVNLRKFFDRIGTSKITNLRVNNEHILGCDGAITYKPINAKLIITILNNKQFFCKLGE